MKGVSRIQFGAFGVDVRACQLRKHGVPLKIRRQPVEILLMLLERPGEVVLREEIRERLWPDNTIVEFEHSINAAVGKLRDALGESAASPRYIETVPRRGYRFLGSIDHVEGSAKTVAAPAGDIERALPSPATVPSFLPRPASHGMLAIAAVVCLVLTGGWVTLIQPRGKAQRWILPVGSTEAEVSPNGTAVVWRDAHGLLLRGFDAPGERRIFSVAAVTDVPAWSPDSSQVAVATATALHRVRVSDGASSLVCRLEGPTRGLSWSRSGTLLLASVSRGIGELYAIPSEGGIPLMRDGKIIGAIGCSGATSAQDAQACQAGVDTIK